MPSSMMKLRSSETPPEKKPTYFNFTCYDCGETFDQQADLEDHERQIHKLCEMCQMGFPTIRELSQHIHELHDLYYCTNCKRSHPTKKEYKMCMNDVGYGGSPKKRKNQYKFKRRKSYTRDYRTSTIKEEPESDEDVKDGELKNACKVIPNDKEVTLNEGDSMEDSGTSMEVEEVAEPAAAESLVTEPVVTDPVVTDPVVSDPMVADPVGADPEVTEPAAAESLVTEPVVSDPVVADPVVTNPVVSEPMVADPVVSEPVVTQPVVIEPMVTDPEVTDPVVTEPVVSDPVVSEPVVADPVVPEPVVTQPVVIESVVIEPVVAEPEVAEPRLAEKIRLKKAGNGKWKRDKDSVSKSPSSSSKKSRRGKKRKRLNSPPPFDVGSQSATSSSKSRSKRSKGKTASQTGSAPTSSSWICCHCQTDYRTVVNLQYHLNDHVLTEYPNCESCAKIASQVKAANLMLKSHVLKHTSLDASANGQKLATTLVSTSKNNPDILSDLSLSRTVQAQAEKRREEPKKKTEKRSEEGKSDVKQAATNQLNWSELNLSLQTFSPLPEAELAAIEDPLTRHLYLSCFAYWRQWKKQQSPPSQQSPHQQPQQQMTTVTKRNISFSRNLRNQHHSASPASVIRETAQVNNSTDQSTPLNLSSSTVLTSSLTNKSSELAAVGISPPTTSSLVAPAETSAISTPTVALAGPFANSTPTVAPAGTSAISTSTVPLAGPSSNSTPTVAFAGPSASSTPTVALAGTSAISTPTVVSARTSAISTPKVALAGLSSNSTPTVAPARTSATSTPKVALAGPSAISTQTVASAKTSAISIPTVALAGPSANSTPTVALARPSAISTPTVASAGTSAIFTPKVALAGPSANSTPTVAPAETSAISTPTVAPARTSVISTPTVVSAGTSAIFTPKVALAGPSANSTPTVPLAGPSSNSTPTVALARPSAISTPTVAPAGTSAISIPTVALAGPSANSISKMAIKTENKVRAASSLSSRTEEELKIEKSTRHYKCANDGCTFDTDCQGSFLRHCEVTHPVKLPDRMSCKKAFSLLYRCRKCTDEFKKLDAILQHHKSCYNFNCQFECGAVLDNDNDVMNHHTEHLKIMFEEDATLLAAQKAAAEQTAAKDVVDRSPQAAANPPPSNSPQSPPSAKSVQTLRGTASPTNAPLHRSCHQEEPSAQQQFQRQSTPTILTTTITNSETGRSCTDTVTFPVAQTQDTAVDKPRNQPGALQPRGRIRQFPSGSETSQSKPPAKRAKVLSNTSEQLGSSGSSSQPVSRQSPKQPQLPTAANSTTVPKPSSVGESAGPTSAKPPISLEQHFQLLKTLDSRNTLERMPDGSFSLTIHLPNPPEERQAAVKRMEEVTGYKYNFTNESSETSTTTAATTATTATTAATAASISHSASPSGLTSVSATATTVPATARAPATATASATVTTSTGGHKTLVTSTPSVQHSYSKRTPTVPPLPVRNIYNSDEGAAKQHQLSKFPVQPGSDKIASPRSHLERLLKKPAPSLANYSYIQPSPQAGALNLIAHHSTQHHQLAKNSPLKVVPSKKVFDRPAGQTLGSIATSKAGPKVLPPVQTTTITLVPQKSRPVAATSAATAATSGGVPRGSFVQLPPYTANNPRMVMGNGTARVFPQMHLQMQQTPEGRVVHQLPPGVKLAQVQRQQSLQLRPQVQQKSPQSGLVPANGNGAPMMMMTAPFAITQLARQAAPLTQFQKQQIFNGRQVTILPRNPPTTGMNYPSTSSQHISNQRFSTSR